MKVQNKNDILYSERLPTKQKSFIKRLDNLNQINNNKIQYKKIEAFKDLKNSFIRSDKKLKSNIYIMADKQKQRLISLCSNKSISNLIQEYKEKNGKINKDENNLYCNDIFLQAIAKLPKIKNTLSPKTDLSFLKKNVIKTNRKKSLIQINTHIKNHYSNNIRIRNKKIFANLINSISKAFPGNIADYFEDDVENYQIAQLNGINQKIKSGEEYVNLSKAAEPGKYFYINNVEQYLKTEREKNNTESNNNNLHNDKEENLEPIFINSKKKHKKNKSIDCKNELINVFKISKKKEKKTIKLYNNVNVNYIQCLSENGKNEDGSKKINLHSYMEISNVIGNKNFYIFGLMVGHGENGQLASQYIDNYIKNFFILDEKKIKRCNDDSEIYNLLTKNEYAFITNLMEDCNNFLCDNKDIDFSYSGTTCLLIFIINNHLICSNIGDNRAILIDKKEIIQLTMEQNLSSSEERERILESGGKIFQRLNDNSYYMSIHCGFELEITRSIGDEKLKKFGVIYQPVITEYTIGKKSKSLVIGTKSIWDNFDNEKVAKIIEKGYNNSNPLEACKDLLAKNNSKCKKLKIPKDETTVMTVFFG